MQLSVRLMVERQKVMRISDWILSSQFIDRGVIALDGLNLLHLLFWFDLVDLRDARNFSRSAINPLNLRAHMVALHNVCRGTAAPRSIELRPCYYNLEHLFSCDISAPATGCRLNRVGAVGGNGVD